MAATLNLSETLMALLQAVTASERSPGNLAALSHSRTTGFVIYEQAFLELKDTDEWDALVQQIADSGYRRPAKADDLIAILTGDRDGRFNTGLDMILTGLVRVSQPRQTNRGPSGYPFDDVDPGPRAGERRPAVNNVMSRNTWFATGETGLFHQMLSTRTVLTPPTSLDRQRCSGPMGDIE